MKNNPLILIENETSPGMAEAARDRGIGVIPASIGAFASGEPFVELFPKGEKDAAANAARLAGREVIVVQSGAESALHLLMMVHTVKAYGAARVTVVMPFAPLMRQDRPFDARFVSLGAAFLAGQLKAAGADRVVTMTPHSQSAIKAYENVFGADFTVLSSTALFAEDIRRRHGSDPAALAVGAPDGANKAGDEGQRRARRLARALFGRDDDGVLFLIAKEHTGVNDTKIVSFTGEVAGKACAIIDDMIDGGSTMINAASLLKARGAASVTACASHGILSGNALEKILSARPDGQNVAIDRLVLTDSLPGVEKKIAALAAKQPKLAARVRVVKTAEALLQAALHAPGKPNAAPKSAAAPRRGP